jgi:hypothetical protein
LIKKVVRHRMIQCFGLSVPLLFFQLAFSPAPQTEYLYLPRVVQLSFPPVPQTQVDEYLPRVLYPGTYGNYCGPTPETTPRDGCRAHGWHGDESLDFVDEACRIHDIAYCHCEAALEHRKGVQDMPLVSALTALRFITGPLLIQEGADSEYLSCVNKADRQLITEGVRIRGEQQRDGCKNGLSWFCKPFTGTLESFEQVSLNLFLKSLDADEEQARSTGGGGGGGAMMPRTSLLELEGKREADFTAAIQRGENVADAAASVQQHDDQIIQKLR